MREQTANLNLPYILPSQAQKHISHNEALQRLDALVEMVIDTQLAMPPEHPVEGQCCIVGRNAGGAWHRQEGKIAFFVSGGWEFIVPRPGWRAYLFELGRLCVFKDDDWHPISLSVDGQLPELGINTPAKAGQRLAVASGASLFTHEGHGHRMTINKKDLADTASLIFQSGWSGRAEIGLAGEDRLSFKVSPDGNDWHTALTLDPGGAVLMPGRPAASAALAGEHVVLTAKTRLGFAAPAIAQGSIVLGADPPPQGGYLTVPLSGLYMLGLNAMIVNSQGFSLWLDINDTRPVATLASDPSSTPKRLSCTGIARLDAGDRLGLSFDGHAEFKAGNGQTEAWIVMI